ncbi:hypothetical protein KP509_14G088900 [Ceratopteris richardii]|nr:hypothetical protein KP509_14G088900 [Ceratopteris richardii]
MLPGCEAHYSVRYLFTPEGCKDKYSSHWKICRNYQIPERSCTTRACIRKSDSECSLYLSLCVCSAGIGVTGKIYEGYVHEINKIASTYLSISSLALQRERFSATNQNPIKGSDPL